MNYALLGMASEEMHHACPAPCAGWTWERRLGALRRRIEGEAEALEEALDVRQP